MSFSIENYLKTGLTRLVKDALKVSLKNPKQSAFFLNFNKEIKKADKIREKHEKNGLHVPSFLISSITNNCNLNCAGCYAMANHECKEHEELAISDWNRIFSEAEEIGISVILLAGGEPLMRKDILDLAAKHRNVMFPVFTNGLLLNSLALDFFRQNRNLIPIVSIEGNEEKTNLRRGEGVYSRILEVTNNLHIADLLYGMSVTVTAKNLYEVTDISFINGLRENGCKALIYVEYVPVTASDLALDEDKRAILISRTEQYRKNLDDIILILFPGDEAESNGCLAAGRGFFHINASGGAEPCPFSPYSDVNLKDVSLIEALKSPLFTRLREEGLLEKKHTGGCVLFEQKEDVEKLLESI